MKTLIYLQGKKSLSKSGIGRAISHQTRALNSQGIEVTYDKNDTFDLAHLNSYQPETFRLLRKLKNEGYKVIVHGHSTHEDFKDSFRLWRLMEPFYDHWMDSMYTHADLIITPTEYSKKLIGNIKGVTCPIKAISNGIDIKEYAPDAEAVKAFEERFSLQPGQKTVIGTGFYFKRKGIDDFFEVARAFPEVKFIWFGYLSKGLTQIKILRAIRHRPDNVILPGYISGKIIKGAYQRASCMLFPTHEETEGIVALEAMASFCPLVIRDIGVYEGWLENGVSCFKAKDNDGFIAAVRSCLAGQGQKLVLPAYEIAKKHDLPLIGAQLKAAYEELLETGKKEIKTK